MKIYAYKDFLDCDGNVIEEKYEAEIPFNVDESTLLSSVLELGDYSKVPLPMYGSSISDVLKKFNIIESPYNGFKQFKKIESEAFGSLKFVFWDRKNDISRKWIDEEEIDKKEGLNGKHV